MIGDMQLSALQEFMPATLIGDDIRFVRVSTDSRSMEAGDLFVALSGENFDGNRFVAQVAERRAVAAVVSKQQDVDLPQLLVTDTTAALGWLGHINRKRSSAMVVAVTGSQGKTSVKEITGTILKQKREVLVTRGNLNNTLGVPMMLLELDSVHQHAVLELGANAQGEIAWTAMLSDPHIVLINNAAETHLEGFGSLEGVVQAKGEIIDSAPSTRTVVLNADDPHLPSWQQRAGDRRCVTFGFSRQADYRASELNIGANGTQFVLTTPQGQLVCRMPLPGRHNVANALAAAALCLEAGATLEEVSTGLEKVAAVPGRLCPLPGLGGSQLLDDSYNASPSSFKAAIDVLVALEGKGLRKILVAGDMAELGPMAVQAHRDVGLYARDSGVDELWSTGPCSELASQAFGRGGRHFDDKEALVQFANGTLDETSVVLIKGSRSAGMDYVTQQLRSRENV